MFKMRTACWRVDDEDNSTSDADELNSEQPFLEMLGNRIYAIVGAVTEDILIK